MEAELSIEVRQRIGGDTQQVDSQQTSYSAVTYKHILLPVWLLAYRYRNRTYQVMMNAATGEVSGQRPYSLAKISMAVILAAILFVTLWSFSNRGGLRLSFGDDDFENVSPRRVEWIEVR